MSSAQASLWTQLVQQFELPRAPNDVRLVVEQVRWLKGDENQTLAQARPWLAYIFTEIVKRDMPAELALLPFVESAFDPKAVSHADARGLWQFIGTTGQRYGLRKQGGCDGRYDVIQATDAALDHLADLHQETGDWFLALAAYNAGLNRVKTAQQANLAAGKPTDYWHLESLPEETRTYVPRLMALREVLTEQLILQEPVPVLPDQTLLFRQPVGPQTWFQLSSRINVPTNLLKKLNPCWSDGPTQAAQILLPVNAQAVDWLTAWL